MQLLSVLDRPYVTLFAKGQDTNSDESATEIVSLCFKYSANKGSGQTSDMI